MAGSTIGEWIAFHARNTPDKIAVSDHHSGRQFSYKNFNDRSACLATGLSRRFGITKGDRVAILAHNSSDNFEIAASLSRLGAIYCPLNWRLTLSELEYIAADLSPTLIMASPEFAENAAILARLCKMAQLVWPGDGAPSDFETLIEENEPWRADFAAHPDDIYIIMYTSGTTGRPKGAIITHKMNLYNALNTLTVCGLSNNAVNLSPLPQFHIAGINCYAGPTFYVGGQVFVMRRVDGGEIIEVLKDSSIGVSHICGVPTLFQIISDHPDFAGLDLSSLKTLGSGGSAASETLIRKWQSRGVALQQGFGMTETSPSVMALGSEQAIAKIGSCGKPLMHAKAKICDVDGNEITEPGVIGELWFKGPSITPGYWNNEKATKDSIVDGWLKTGDAARRDEDGFYYIVDRWKDMYKSGGENVYPAEIENLLYELGAVKEVAVIGVPDERWEEVGRAYIVLHEGKALSEAEVMRHCEDRLARFKQPRSVCFLKELPHNATGKILKRVLRDEAKREYDATRKQGAQKA